ncbi:MAG: hypothetical protein AUJ58_04530 [Zetaproteobacteria bacterium CG1_02_55_237]|nr:MAG: hypothetical protein AUJ58_04530 [Zetaproteobacteria bacterium CG1_02_55_237]
MKMSLLIVVVAALFFSASFVKMPGIDRLANAYFAESIKAATLAYATTRTVNAVVSVVKESHLEFAPAGVGVSIAAGQVLDPIDDMTECLSTMLVAAIASIGIQKIGFEIGMAVSFKAISILLLLAVPLLWLNGASGASLLQPAIKLCLILLLLRFMLPLSAMISDSIYTTWLKPGVENSLERLSIVSGSYSELKSLPPEQDDGFFSSLRRNASEQVDNTRKAFSIMMQNAEIIVASLLSLMTAYLTIFVVQVLLLPLTMLWLLLSLFRGKPMDEFSGHIVNRLLSVVRTSQGLAKPS